MSDEPQDNHPTFQYVHEQLGKLASRVGRLEVMVGVLIAANLSPRFGGPQPTELVSTVIHHVT